MLGIDVSKATLSCVLIDPVTRQQQWHKDVSNTPAGWRQLLRSTDPSISWVLEPTGRYGEEVARTARLAGRDVRLAQPKKAQYFLKSVQDRAKTDKLDARGLALYALAFDLKPYPLKSEMHEEMDQLLSARKGLSQSLSELHANAICRVPRRPWRRLYWLCANSLKWWMGRSRIWHRLRNWLLFRNCWKCPALARLRLPRRLPV